MHDSPSKHLFSRDKKVFRHSSIHVQNPELLTDMILSDDEQWDKIKIDEAMQAGKEKWYTLKNKIPV